MYKNRCGSTQEIRNCRLVYSINREKPHQLILQQEFIQNMANNQMFILGEMVFQITWAVLQRKMIVFVNEIVNVYK